MTKNISVTKDKESWRAQLGLEISKRESKSVVAKSWQKGPLTIQSPFYPEGDVCHLYLLHPPAGIVGGDKLQLDITTTDEAAALITTPGATKFYRSEHAVAEQYQKFSVEDNSSLEWLPQETIYFPNAKAKLNTTINLSKTANFIGWDIHCLGLPANNRDLEQGNAKVGFSLYRDNKPLLIESMTVSVEKKKYQAAFLQNNQIFATFAATGADEALLESIRENNHSAKNGMWGATLMEDLLIIRYLGSSTNEARELFIKSWQLTRPVTLKREATLPRIWAT